MGVEGVPIKDFPDYLIYPNGKVYSLKTNKFLTPQKSGGTKYLKVTIRNENGPKQKLIHRLVAEAFLDNPNNLAEVDHIDCNPLNNNIENLRWMSREDNLERSYQLGNQTHNKKRVAQYDFNNNFIAEYESTCEAKRQTGIFHIHEAANGSRKSAGGYHWRYLEERE